MKFIKDRYVKLLVGLVLFHVIWNLIWIYLNQTPPGFDAAFQTTLSMRFYDHIKSNPGLISFYFDISKYYPPLVHLVGTLFAFIAEFNYKSIQFTGTFFFAISIVFTYLLTDQLFKNKRMAFFSAFFFSFFLTIYEASRQHLLDIPMTAAILASLYFLLRSEHFAKRRETLLFFMCVGIGVMTKWIIIVFFMIPFLFEYINIIKSKIFSRQKLDNVITGLLIACIIVVPWYIHNISKIIAYGSYFSEGTSYSPADLWSVENFIFYLRLIITFLLTPVGTIFFLMSVYFIWKEDKRKEWFLVFSIIFFVYLFFSVVHNKAIRYIFPLMPFFAMVMGYGADNILKKYKDSLLLFFSSFVILFYVFTYFILSFGIPLYPQYKHAYKFPIFGWMDIYYLGTYPVNIIYNKENWQNNVIAKDILNNAGGLGVNRLLVVNDLAHLGPSTVNIAIFEEYGGVPSIVQDLDTNFPAILEGRTLFTNQDELKNYVDQASFVLTTKDSIGPQQAMFDYDIRQQIQQYFIGGLATNFQIIGEYELPDGNTAYLYKRT